MYLKESQEGYRGTWMGGMLYFFSKIKQKIPLF